MKRALGAGAAPADAIGIGEGEQQSGAASDRLAIAGGLGAQLSSAARAPGVAQRCSAP